MADEPTPFDPTFAKADVDRMMEKVRNARLPPNEVMPGKGWEYGTDPDWLVEIQSTWANEWSYEAFEKQLQRYVSSSTFSTGLCLAVRRAASGIDWSTGRPLFLHDLRSCPYDS